MALDPADKFERSVVRFIRHFEAFTLSGYGPRCDSFDPDCKTCQVWLAFDEAKALTDYDKENDRQGGRNG